VDAVLSVNGSAWEELYPSGDSVRSLLCSRSGLEDGGSVVFIEDVTRLREMEAVVARKERLSAVGRLAAGLAHEIRNPLASLSGSVQLLRDEGRSPLHDIVLREVKRLNELVEEFLDSARPVRLSIERVKPGDIIGDVSTSFRNDPRYQGRRVLRARAARLPDVLMDGARFRQVIWNLLLNAAQATPDYGRITIDCVVEGPQLRIDITDDGVGIDPFALRRIFDPFYTTRSGGTGLGLANVERIVRAHDGTIEVESTPGEGTSFTIRLPLGGPSASSRTEEQ
jgi:two-component system sensor histidine kinase PilS (NtrC family)